MQLSTAKSWDEAPPIVPEVQIMPETTVRIRMLKTESGSLNGRDVSEYLAGQEYTLPDQGEQGLAAVFVRENWAERVLPEVEADLPPEAQEAASERGARRRGGK